MRSLFGLDTEKKLMKRTHLCYLKIRIEEISGTVIKENFQKYQNIKISKQPITVTCEIELILELALLLTGTKKLWMHQILFFTFSLRYFVDQYDREFYRSTDQKFFS